MAESVIRNPIMYDLDEDFFITFNLQQENVIADGMCGQIVLAVPLEKKEDRCVVKKFTLLVEEDRARNDKLFYAEVQFMQSFDHPFIMKCLYAGRCSDYMAHCTDYYHRGTLNECVGELSLELSELYFTKVACALRYLHKNNVVHLDVKLDNIFLDDDNNAILGDFGLAVELFPLQKVITKDQCGGTPCYFAPERIGAADAKKLDPYKVSERKRHLGETKFIKFQAEFTLDNIFLDDDNNAILGDFGLAVELFPLQKVITKDQCGGTPCYFAPERIGAADAKKLDPYKMDSYCLGVVMWALVQEKFPNNGINYYLEARRNKDIPSNMRRWLLKLLDRNPSKRLTVKDFLNRLRREGMYRYVVDNN